MATWLEKKLEYANQAILGKKLKNLLNIHKEVMQQFIPNLKKFAYKITATRNHSTHLSERNKKQSIPEQAMYPYIIRLRILIECIMLKELEVYHIFFSHKIQVPGHGFGKYEP